MIPNIRTRARPESAKVISAEDIREIIKDVKGLKPEVVHARKLYIAVFPAELVEDLKRFKASGYEMRKDNTYKRTMLNHPKKHMFAFLD